ncbi:DNA invertase Pin-like site-specific DNA recombinase [Paraburkholderia sp. GAS206C]|jgi:putative DNA-invertase from lambdoid prophage Rac|uniref:Resolvase, N terminal domain n=1 Tax=Paraburkholderia phenazinium TaxID=60549 RepID=A0A1N6JRC3_9BURK|nr:Resolvase, N terminal domain [Paraburkholderia phenazinium]
MEAPSAAGDLITRTFAAFAQSERDQLMERTHANVAQAKAEGKISGRMLSLTATQRTENQRCRCSQSVTGIAGNHSH